MKRRVPIGAVVILVLAGLATALAPTPSRSPRIAGTVRLCRKAHGQLGRCSSPDGRVTIGRGAGDVGARARIAQGQFSLPVYPGMRVLEVRVPGGSDDTAVRALDGRTTMVHLTYAAGS